MKRCEGTNEREQLIIADERDFVDFNMLKIIRFVQTQMLEPRMQFNFAPATATYVISGFHFGIEIPLTSTSFIEPI